MGFLSVPNLVPWLVFRAWIVTDQLCWISLHFNLTTWQGGKKKGREDGESGGEGAIIRGKRLIENLLYCLAKQILVFLGNKEANFCWEVLSLRSKLFRFLAALLLASFFGRSMNFLVLYSETAFPWKLHLNSEFAHFKLHRSYSIFSVESERTVSKFRRGERQLLCCVHLLHKASLWN